MPGSVSGGSATPLPVVAIIPAKDEAARIAATIGAVRRITAIAAVIVVDDGSRDGTGRIAAACEVEIVRHARNRGKAEALMSGLGRMAALQRVGRVGSGAAALFVDADLEDIGRGGRCARRAGGRR